MPDITIRIPAIDKLLDYTASGVGAIAGPILANWKAAREGRARIALPPELPLRFARLKLAQKQRSLEIIADAQSQGKTPSHCTRRRSARGI